MKTAANPRGTTTAGSCGVCKKLVCFKCERGGVCRVCQAEREQADRRNRSFAQFDNGKTCPEVREFFGFSREMTSQLFQEWRESRREAE